MWVYYLSVTSFLNFISSTFVAFLVLSHDFKSPTNRAFSFFALSVSFWSFFYFLWQLSDVEDAALYWSKMFMVGAVVIPATFFHFSVCLINRQKKYLIFVLSFYLISSFFVLGVLQNLIISGVRQVNVFPFWPIPGQYFLLFLGFFSATIVCAHYLIYSHFQSLSGRQRQQIVYVFLGTLIGFVGGASNYPLWFEIDFLPYGNILVSVYVVMTAYAIIKYKFLDLKIAITKTGLFFVILSISFGFPMFLAFTTQNFLFYFLGRYWWVVPMSLVSFFSIIGFGLYLYIQRRAEEHLLEEQRRYQTTIRQASVGMGRIKKLDKLMELVVYIITRAARVKSCAMYYAEETKMPYQLKASKCYDGQTFPKQVSFNGKVVRTLNRSHTVLNRDIVIQQKQDNLNTMVYDQLLQELDQLQAALVLPCFIENRLVAICAIGQKQSREVFSDDDINVFSVLINQAALAIENALFYDNMKRTHEQLYKAEKMATIGTLADGISHQINNRLHAMGFIAGDALDTLNLSKEKCHDNDTQALIEEMQFSLGRIQDNVKKGGEIVEGLLKYTRKGEGNFGEVHLKELLDSSYEIVKYKFKESFHRVYDFDDSLPAIKGNFTQLQEVFLNLMDNAYDAMLERKTTLKEPDYQMQFRVSTEILVRRMRIIVEDNGIGVKQDDVKKLFTPFFTTKTTSKKGTGLGLYVIQKVIEENHGGTVHFKSVYKKGTKILIDLPLFDDT